MSATALRVIQAARVVVAAMVDDESGMETFDFAHVVALGEAIADLDDQLPQRYAPDFSGHMLPAEDGRWIEWTERAARPENGGTPGPDKHECPLCGAQHPVVWTDVAHDRTGDEVTEDRRRPYTAEIGANALVRRADGSLINFGDALYHPENADEARRFAARPPSGDAGGCCGHEQSCPLCGKLIFCGPDASES